MTQKAPEYHIAVLGPETSQWLLTDPDGVYLDATVGGGGHAQLLLERMGPKGRLIGIDRDPEAIREASERLRKFGGRVRLVQGCFWELSEILRGLGVFRVSGALFDLGVSSHQIDDPGRGFSFQQDGPLDMRMGPDASRSAQEVVNAYPPESLVRIFRDYGQEQAAVRIARAICRRRAQAPLTRTLELADLIASAVRPPGLQKSLARIFQAIRIEVNKELEHLEGALYRAVDALRPGGRIGVLSYHSLEDRTVKRVFRTSARGCICPADLPVCACGRQPTLQAMTPRGVRAGTDERARNPRSRSATLRVARHL